MACDATSLLATAYAAGYARLSERDLKAAILASACAGASTPGAGTVTAGAGVPVGVATPGSVYTQGSGPSVHVWVADTAGVWQQIV